MSTLHPDPTRLLKDWLSQPDVQAKLQAISEHAIDFFWSDTTVRVPRTQEERQQSFALWLQGHHERYIKYLHGEFEKEFPGIEKHLTDPLGLWDFVVQGIWSDITLEMRRYAIRGLAFVWVRDRYRDTIYPGKPELSEGDLWLVPLLQKENPDALGEIFFDQNGDFSRADVSVAPREPRISRQPYTVNRLTVA